MKTNFSSASYRAPASFARPRCARKPIYLLLPLLTHFGVTNFTPSGALAIALSLKIPCWQKPVIITTNHENSPDDEDPHDHPSLNLAMIVMVIKWTWVLSPTTQRMQAPPLGGHRVTGFVFAKKALTDKASRWTSVPVWIFVWIVSTQQYRDCVYHKVEVLCLLYLRICCDETLIYSKKINLRILGVGGNCVVLRSHSVRRACTCFRRGYVENANLKGIRTSTTNIMTIQ